MAVYLTRFNRGLGVFGESLYSTQDDDQVVMEVKIDGQVTIRLFAIEEIGEKNHFVCTEEHVKAIKSWGDEMVDMMDSKTIG